MKQNAKPYVANILLGLLCVLNVLFLVYWVALSLNYCLHYDDVHFMWKMREYSIFEYVHEMYMTRGGNFVGYGINGLIFTLSNWFGGYRAWPLIFYAIGIAMVYGAAKGLIKDLPDWKVLIGVVALYNVYILTVPDYAVFTWLCAMGYFLYAPAMCLMLRFLNEESLSGWKWGVLILLALFLSGSNVTITPMIWVLMLVNALWIWRTYRWNVRAAWETKTIKRIVFITLGMLVVYAIMFIAPGNFSRLEMGSDMNHPASIGQFVVAWGKCMAMFIYFMAFYLPYHLLAVGLGYIVGYRYIHIRLQAWKGCVAAVVAFFVYLGIAVIPLAYLSNGFGIQRNYTQITFFYMLMWFALGYFWGNGHNRERVGNAICVLSALLLIMVMIVNIVVDVPIAINYNRAHQAREAKLLEWQTKGNKEQVVVERYPSSATIDSKYMVWKALGKTTNKQSIYYESDTDVDPNEYESHIRKLLGLDFDFVLNE